MKTVFSADVLQQMRTQDAVSYSALRNTARSSGPGFFSHKQTPQNSYDKAVSNIAKYAAGKNGINNLAALPVNSVDTQLAQRLLADIKKAGFTLTINNMNAAPIPEQVVQPTNNRRNAI